MAIVLYCFDINFIPSVWDCKKKSFVDTDAVDNDTAQMNIRQYWYVKS